MIGGKAKIVWGRAGKRKRKLRPAKKQKEKKKSTEEKIPVHSVTGDTHLAR